MSDGRRQIRVEAVLCWGVATLAWLALTPTGMGTLRVASTCELPGAPTQDAMLSGQRVPLHRANRGELESLPGLGPVLAGRVLAARGEGACWGDLAALAEVHGIGPHTIEGLRGFAYAGCLP